MLPLCILNIGETLFDLPNQCGCCPNMKYWVLPLPLHQTYHIMFLHQNTLFPIFLNTLNGGACIMVSTYKVNDHTLHSYWHPWIHYLASRLGKTNMNWDNTMRIGSSIMATNHNLWRQGSHLSVGSQQCHTSKIVSLKTPPIGSTLIDGHKAKSVYLHFKLLTIGLEDPTQGLLILLL